VESVLLLYPVAG